ncbi:hypothetical protein [Brevundimonas sp.]|uniref:hypothetical protein n=1 Tax=Brevundimonas sp. TaxID=1871086 RepID=UPI0025CC76F7|nr:hypothetical protein [Brevundimonas sp.]
MPRLTPAIVLSALFHLGLLALALIAWPRQPVDIQLGAVPVTVVSDVFQDAAPSPETADDPLEEISPEPLPSEADTPEPPAPTPTPAPPQPTPPTKRPPTTTAQPDRTPQRPPQQPQQPTQTREESSLDLDAIAGGGGPRRPPRPPGRPPTESGSGQAAVLTGPQVAAFGRQVVPHWNLTFCNMAGGDDMTIRMRLTIGANGRISEGPVLVQQQSGSVYRAASESALRAARAAEPYDVPVGYRTSEMTFVFLTEQACRGR